MIKYAEYLRFRVLMKPLKRLKLAQIFKSNEKIKTGCEE